MNLRLFFLFSLGLLLVFSCGSLPPSPPRDYEDLTELNQKGNTAYEQKEYSRALSCYSQALRISRSLDNTQSTATNLINMAIIYRKLKNHERADAVLEETLALEGLSPGLLSEAQFQKALLNLDTGHPDAALSWAEKSLATCQASAEGDASLASRWNLLGRIAFQKDNYQNAFALASRGLQLSKRYEVPAEEANALRLTAEIKTKEKDLVAAVKYYQQALAMDKDLGKSGKILLDLKGLAEVYALQGKPKEAAEYYRRAYEVAKNSGEAEEAQLILQKLGLIRLQKNQSEP